MIKRDILVDEVEQLGKVLAMIIAKFFKDKSTYENIQKTFSETNILIQSKISIDIDEVLKLEEEVFIAYFEKLKLPINDIEKLIDYMVEIGIYQLDQDFELGKQTLVKCLLAYDWITVKTKTLSLGRIEKENRIKSLLN